MGKTQLIRDQQRHHGLNFLGLQETRCPEVCGAADGILRLGGGAERGHWGVELWINLRQPIAFIGSTAIYLEPKDVLVVQKSPRILLVRVEHRLWSAWIVVAHAPQSGQSATARTEWWSSLHEMLLRYVGQEPLFALMDANAEPGLTDHVSVGDKTFPVSRSTGLFREFLEQFGLCLPCTFNCHVGPTTTWTAPDGFTTACIDHVCIPQRFLPRCQHSQVLELGNGDLDHCAVAAQLQWTESVQEGKKVNKLPPIDRSAISRETLDVALRASPSPCMAHRH